MTQGSNALSDFKEILTKSKFEFKSYPSIKTWPLSLAKTPDKIFIVVDFPAPLIPKKENNSPFFTLLV